MAYEAKQVTLQPTDLLTAQIKTKHPVIFILFIANETSIPTYQTLFTLQAIPHADLALLPN